MKTFRLLLLVGLVFLAGVAAGVVGTRIAVRHWVHSAILRPQMVQMDIERRLKWRLQLDANQQAQVHQILTDAHGQLRELRQEYRPQVAEVVSNADAKISALLTPAQRERFEKMKERNRAILRPIEPGR
jgi:Spy/CpxP family protein refolding chaperone